jgi:hypothetical protein
MELICAIRIPGWNPDLHKSYPKLSYGDPHLVGPAADL